MRVLVLQGFGLRLICKKRYLLAGRTYLTVPFELSSCTLFDFGRDGKFSSLRLSCGSDERSCIDEPVWLRLGRVTRSPSM